jgi:photosynthetic reaction center M subunit
VDNWYMWGVKHDIAPAYPAVYAPVVIDPAIGAPAIDPRIGTGIGAGGIK